MGTRRSQWGPQGPYGDPRNQMENPRTQWGPQEHNDNHKNPTMTPKTQQGSQSKRHLPPGVSCCAPPPILWRPRPPPTPYTPLTPAMPVAGGPAVLWVQPIELSGSRFAPNPPGETRDPPSPHPRAVPVPGVPRGPTRSSSRCRGRAAAGRCAAHWRARPAAPWPGRTARGGASWQCSACPRAAARSLGGWGGGRWHTLGLGDTTPRGSPPPAAHRGAVWGRGTFDGDAHLFGVAGAHLTGTVHAQLEDPQELCGGERGEGGSLGEMWGYFGGHFLGLCSPLPLSH